MRAASTQSIAPLPRLYSRPHSALTSRLSITASPPPPSPSLCLFLPWSLHCPCDGCCEALSLGLAVSVRSFSVVPSENLGVLVLIHQPLQATLSLSPSANTHPPRIHIRTLVAQARPAASRPYNLRWLTCVSPQLQSRQHLVPSSACFVSPFVAPVALDRPTKHRRLLAPVVRFLERIPRISL